jgi:two-component system KDP operon response regulator KdpE/two-component system response regulator MprA
MENQDLVLVVDDDQAIVDALRMLLELAGYGAQGYSGGDVLEQIKKIQPDLLLLDVWLNGQDGREICRRVKADAAIGTLPVILISASRDLAATAKLAGADDFIEKPFDMDVVVAKVHRLLEPSVIQ